MKLHTTTHKLIQIDDTIFVRIDQQKQAPNVIRRNAQRFHETAQPREGGFLEFFPSVWPSFFFGTFLGWASLGRFFSPTAIALRSSAIVKFSGQNWLRTLSGSSLWLSGAGLSWAAKRFCRRFVPGASSSHRLWPQAASLPPRSVESQRMRSTSAQTFAMCCTTWDWFLDSGQPNSNSTRLSGLFGTWNRAGQFHKTCSFEPCWWWQNGQRPFERPRVMTENLNGLTNAPVKQATSCMLPKDARNSATRHRVASYSSWRKFWKLSDSFKSLMNRIFYGPLFLISVLKNSMATNRRLWPKPPKSVLVRSSQMVPPLLNFNFSSLSSCNTWVSTPLAVKPGAQAWFWLPGYQFF